MTGYRREIDGLRALAVLPVIFFHAGFQTFSGGFVGVDVFFVISGYLITTLILVEKQAGTFSLLNFYERRARRILPALFLVMFTCLPFSLVWLLPQDMKNFSKSILAVSLFVSNVFFVKQSNYFATGVELNPLLHTWSLAVEEQYYLFFPVFLMLVWRLGRRWILVILVVMSVISLAAAQRGSETDPAATFYLLSTRGWELLIGAIVAFCLSENTSPEFGKSETQVGSAIGLLLLVYSVFAFDKQTPFPSVYTVIPTIGTALIIACATKSTLVGKLLGNNLFVGVGMISYSAYLWHQPLFAFAKYRSLEDPSRLLLGALVMVAVVLAYFSWKYVETPFRNRQRFNGRQILLFGATGTVFFIVLAIVGYSNGGLKNRLTPSQREVATYSSYAYKDIYREGVCLLKPDQTYKAFSDVCRSSSSKDSLLIWGDSHAAALSFGLREILPNVIQYNTSVCPPIKDAVISSRPHCKSANDFVMREIQKIAPKRIFLHANWSLYKEQGLIPNLSKTIEYIQSVSPAIEITIVGPVPQWPQTLPTYMMKRHMGLDREYYGTISSYEELNLLDVALEAVAKENNVKFLSALRALCEKQRCMATTSYEHKLTLTAWDYGHLTKGGSAFLARKLLGDYPGGFSGR